MKVILAGYNIDTGLIKKLKRLSSNNVFTPETISAAYARISRSPRSVSTLRKEALKEVEKARLSNRRIIFEMSHHSIAEHAVFNFDIIGISRRAVEEVERFRLCSYTEKSQRYVTLEGDYVIPEEIKNSKFVDEYCTIISEQNNLYKILLEKLKSYRLKNQPGVSDPKILKNIENAAKEDARYILSLATQTQLGTTINARNLELMIRRFASHELDEIRKLGNHLYRQVKHIAPSIILFYRANDYDQRTYPELKEYCDKIKVLNDLNSEVRLEDYTRDGDDKILASLLFRVGRSSFEQCLTAVKKLSRKEKIELFKNACKYLELYDTLPREFEMVNYTFSAVVSGSCFAQLKRHRMMTLINQDYDPLLGITIPPSIKEIKMEEEFKKVIKKTEKLYKKIVKISPPAASYILTNAHRKRVLINLNLRELYHIVRLREDPTAQWDIQNIVHSMSEKAKKVTPLTTLLLCSKTEYPERYHELYKKYPKVTKVPLPG
ncbi:MAG: FAD-dependent thymidylate synthase [candidate division WOR-3 bacterium]|nr:FAD-dependent thymidylate synthase [candidate division WOR-3 bacterium]